jgi:hypothetical protein
MSIFPVECCCRCEDMVSDWPWYIDPLFEVCAFINERVLGATSYAVKVNDNEDIV